MSHKATYWLATIDPARISAGSFRVLFHLCDHHNDERSPEAACFPSQETLRRKTGLSNSGLNKCIDALESAGLLSRKRATAPGSSLRRTYYILGCDIGSCATQTPLSGVRANSTTDELGAGQTPPEETANSTTVDCKLHLSGEEPVREPVKEPGKEQIGFSEFWKIVPVKVSKQDALAAWKRLSADDRELAARHVVAFYAWFRKTYPSANPLHPVRYLSKKRWEDVAGAIGTEATVNLDAIRAGLNSRVPSVREHARELAKRHGINLEAAE